MTDRAVFADTVEWVPIDSLHPHPSNPRQGDVGAISESLEANGLYRPILVQGASNMIIAGHHLWRALRHLGADTVPVLRLPVDNPTALRILLADNRSADLGSYDESALSALLVNIVEREGVGGLAGTLYDGDTLDDLLKQDEPLKFSSPATVHTCPSCGAQFTKDDGP